MPSPELFNLEFQAGNSRRNYPLRDDANKRDDDGKELPDALISDLNIWYPESYGNYVFISSVTVTPQMVSLTIAAQPDDPFTGASVSSFLPLAAVIVVKPVEFGRTYALRPMVDGVGGWISFGDEINSLPAGSYRFTDSKQTGVLGRLVRRYPEAGVTSVGKKGFATKITGLVKLVSGDPDLLVIEKGQETINGVLRDCVIFRLNEEVAGRDVYGQFLGPCGGVPESLSCRSKPIHRINQITPDCDGVITLYLKEALAVGGTPELVLSYADTNHDETEPTPSDPPTAHTLNLDFNRGMSSICTSIPAVFTKDQLDECDNACGQEFQQTHPLTNDDGTAKGGEGKGLNNVAYSWQTGYREEPFNEKGTGFLIQGDPVDIDVTYADKVTFQGSSDDITILMPGTGSVVQSPAENVYTKLSPVTFTIPSQSMIFRDSKGWLRTPRWGSKENAHQVTVRKTITDGTHTYVITKGDLPGTKEHVINLEAGGFTTWDWGTSRTISQLETAGLVVTVGSQKILRVRPAHIVCGIGFANLEIVVPVVNPLLDDDCNHSSSLAAPP